ncbi:leukotriene A4 hydrolase-like protein [Marinicella litoralis]|uniref:Aminopeptidase N n=2 Tax=Marinicella litoralis TaxID=644220 RepID=A0A4R6XM04_9GAMM|nr:leukotriene A4 hydrolase-like protein [Marinicella litoralis]
MRLIILTCFFLCGCQSPIKPSQPEATLETAETMDTLPQRPDVFSFSRHDQVKITHLDLNLKVKFKQQIMDGFVTINYKVIKPQANQLILDTRDLKIKRVESIEAKKTHKLVWRMGQSIEGLGSELIINLPDNHAPIKISYETMPQASGLQWLGAEKTSGKKHPFLFSQSQAVHARSWIPVQDTPSVRVTYNANIQVKAGLKVVMSADNNNQQAIDGIHTFSMQQPIPAYLIAIAIGDLQLQTISEHVTIYAEKEILQAAAYEFASTENMITATEAMYGKYRWGQYDLLILPPSFPFGGMENPKLSHITPTVIAGDRSLDSLIAHELAHSWSGNLVTNALWQDAWLNEGFTSYIEARIIEAIYGTDRMLMESTLIYQSLVEEMSELSEDAQKLINPSKTSDPDDYFSGVAYDKGRFFLEWMEQQVGRPDFDQFLNGYFEQYAFKSITSQDFVAYLEHNLLRQFPHKITEKQVDVWLNQPGLPEFFTPPATQIFTVIDQQVETWLAGDVEAKQINTASWTTQEWLHFLRALPPQLNTEQLHELDHAFQLTQRKNSEIAHDWLKISINNQYQAAYARLIDYLSSIGRVKLIKPLYEALMEHPDLHNLAMNIYIKSRPGYHNIAIKQIDAIVGFKQPE